MAFVVGWRQRTRGRSPIFWTEGFPDTTELDRAIQCQCRKKSFRGVGGEDTKPPSAARGRRPRECIIGRLEMARFMKDLKDVIQGNMDRIVRVFEMVICIGILVAITLCPFCGQRFCGGWGSVCGVGE